MIRSSAKLSKAIQRELKALETGSVVVAAVKTVTVEEAASFESLGIWAENGVIAAGEPAPPPRSCGLYARRNLDGWRVKRKDLPKADREVSSWVPNWHNSGHHLVSWTMQAYPVEYHPAKMLSVSSTVLETLVDGAIVRFRVDQPLGREHADFAQDLNFNLRLLRECVGDAHVFDADLTDDEYARIQTVHWEMLPRGAAGRVLERLASSTTADAERLKVASERLNVLDRLDHDGFLVGTGRFARYFGVRFGSDLVALENLEYGNALYVFEEEWESLTQLSRTELIKRRDPGVHRVPHLPGWQSIIRKLVRDSLRR